MFNSTEHSNGSFALTRMMKRVLANKIQQFWPEFSAKRARKLVEKLVLRHWHRATDKLGHHVKMWVLDEHAGYLTLITVRNSIKGNVHPKYWV